MPTDDTRVLSPFLTFADQVASRLKDANDKYLWIDEIVSGAELEKWLTQAELHARLLAQIEQEVYETAGHERSDDPFNYGRARGRFEVRDHIKALLEQGK
jgi:hypothetical protein